MVNTKTLELTANVVSKINFDKKYPYIYIKNFGDTDVYAAEFNDIIPDADGVTRISAGTVGLIYRECIIDDLYVIASDNCKIEIIGAYDANLSFSKKIISGGDDYTELKNEISKKEDVSNKVTEITETSTDEQYPSAKAVYDLANAGYEVKKITLNNGIGYRSWNADVYKFPNNLGIIFLNITWDNPSDTYNLKIGTMPNDCKPLFPISQNIVSNGYLDNKNITYLNVETTGEIYVHTGNISAVVPATGIRLIIPYIIA